MGVWSDRGNFVRVLIVYIINMLSCVAWGNDLRVDGADQVPLHSIEDYLDQVPDGEFAKEDLAEIRRQAVVKKFDELTREGGYLLSATSATPAARVSSVYQWAPESELAAEAAQGFYAALLRSMVEAGYGTRSIACALDYADECRSDLIVHGDGFSIGSLVLVRRGEAMYALMVFGLNGLEDAGSIASFLGKQGDAVLSFRPKLPVPMQGEYADEPSQDLVQKRAREQAYRLGIILVGTFVYLATYRFAALLNRIVGRGLVNRRAFALCSLAVAVIAWIAVLYFNLFGRPEFNDLAPDTKSQVLGVVIGETLGAVVIIPLVVLIRVFLERRKSRAGL